MISRDLADFVEAEDRQGVLASSTWRTGEVGNDNDADGAARRQNGALPHVWHRGKQTIELHAVLAQNVYGRDGVHQTRSIDDMIAEHQPVVSGTFQTLAAAVRTLLGRSSKAADEGQTRSLAEAVDAGGDDEDLESSNPRTVELRDTNGRGASPEWKRKAPTFPTDNASSSTPPASADAPPPFIDEFHCLTKSVPRFLYPPLRFYIFYGCAVAVGWIAWVSNPWVSVLPLLFWFCMGGWLLYLYFTDRTVDSKYNGYVVNRFLKLRTDAAPACYMRSVPTLSFVGCAAFHLANVILIVQLSADNTMGKCSDSSSCKYSVAGITMEGIWPYVFIVNLLTVYAMYFTLRPEGQEALRGAAVVLCRNDPVAREIVNVAERRASFKELSVWRRFPASSTLANAIAAALAVNILIQSLSAERKYFAHNTGATIASLLCVAGTLYMAILVTFAAIYSLYATYVGGKDRLRTVTDFANTRGLCNTADLIAFFHVREFYVGLVNPATFAAGHCLLVIEVFIALYCGCLMFIPWLVTMLSENEPPSKILQASWVLLTLTAVSMSTIWIAVSTIVSVVLEMEDSLALMQDAKVRLGTLHLRVSMNAGRGGAPLGDSYVGVRTSTSTGSEHGQQPQQQQLGSYCWGLHDALGSRSSERSLMNDAARDPDVVNTDAFDALVEGIIWHCREFDIHPTIFGLPINLTFLRALGAYTVSLVTGLLALIYTATDSGDMLAGLAE